MAFWSSEKRDKRNELIAHSLLDTGVWLPDLGREHGWVWDQIRANDARLVRIGQRLDQIARDLVEVEDPDGKRAIMLERRTLLKEQEMIKLEQVDLKQEESELNSDLNAAILQAQ